MSEYYSGAYFVRRRGGAHGKRAAGVLIAVLLLLTAAICLLVVFLPKITSDESVPTGGGVTRKKFYILTTYVGSFRDDALLAAHDTSARGGAGYVYNDGEYKVVAAVYDSEADARALASVNDNAQYFEISIALPESTDDGTVGAVEYLAGEWFDSVRRAADDLQRGSITEAQAEYAARSVCAVLSQKSELAQNSAVRRALDAACEYDCPQSVTPLAYIRYIQVRAIVSVCDGLSV